jgi:S-adenosylmethionine decarboxylase
MIYSRPMPGLHLTADLYQCRCEAQWLTDAAQLGAWSRQAADALGLSVEHEVFHPAAAGSGVSAVLLLPHSHVCLHTWPERRGATIDVYLADAREDLSAKARGLMYALVQRLQPEWTEQRSLDRGAEQ